MPRPQLDVVDVSDRPASYRHQAPVSLSRPARGNNHLDTLPSVYKWCKAQKIAFKKLKDVPEDATPTHTLTDSFRAGFGVICVPVHLRHQFFTEAALSFRRMQPFYIGEVTPKGSTARLSMDLDIYFRESRVRETETMFDALITEIYTRVSEVSTPNNCRRIVVATSGKSISTSKNPAGVNETVSKFGLHVVFPHLIVTADTSQGIRRYVVEHLDKKFAADGLCRGYTLRDSWSTIYDEHVAKNLNCRMMFANKIVQVKKKAGAACPCMDDRDPAAAGNVCRCFTSEQMTNSYHDGGRQFLLYGAFDNGQRSDHAEDEYNVDLVRLLADCSIHCAPGTLPTPITVPREYMTEMVKKRGRAVVELCDEKKAALESYIHCRWHQLSVQGYKISAMKTSINVLFNSKACSNCLSGSHNSSSNYITITRGFVTHRCFSKKHVVRINGPCSSLCKKDVTPRPLSALLFDKPKPSKQTMYVCYG